MFSSTGSVSVVIINFRGADDTIECVRQTLAVDFPADKLEIIVIENGSGDDSLARLTAAFGDEKQVRIVTSAENLGFTGGCNLGAKSAKGEFLAFLNNDAKPDKGWITAALAQFDVSPAVAAVGSKVLDWDGIAVDFVGPGLTWFGMGFKPNLGRADRPEFDVPRDILFGTGSALFVRRTVFAELGGFDERLFMFYDDVDLGWRLNLRGYRVRFAPDSVVRHKHHGSMKSFGDYREEYLLERNSLMVLYKNIGEENLGRFLAGALALSSRRAIANGKVDSEAFDIRNAGGPDELAEEAKTPKGVLSSVFGVDQFVAELPALQTARAEIQSTRTRTDTEMFRLFDGFFSPLNFDQGFLDGYEAVVAGLGIQQATQRTRILVITGDALGAKMAGPGLRAWKISEALSAEHEVRLVTWNRAARESDAFEVHHVDLQNERQMRVHEEWADVIFFQGYALYHFTTLQASKKVMVVDIYDPMHLEQLEQGREHGAARWNHQVASATEVLNQQLARGDFFLCASDRQRLFWLGQLAALGRVNPDNYAADDKLDGLITLAPFGMDSQPPVKTRKALRGVVPGIGENDKIVIWGGGIYNWFDTLTLVRAVGKVAETHDDIRLFFLGVTHPNPDVPEMAVVQQTRQLAAELGLTDKNVFFNQTWVDLDDRQNYLLEADAGVSTHYDHIETTFSFRTRILDYLWAKLPIVTTDGDSFGDLVAAEGLGVAVPERDVQALADALEKVLYDPEAAAEARANVSRVREDFTWERVLEPLLEFCRHPEPAPDRALELVGGGTAAGSATGRSRGRLGRVAEHPTFSGPMTKEEKFHRIASRRHGFRRDLALARFYVFDGGVPMLRDKITSRLASTRASK
ncbi:glycosyltransferase [Herbiconiux solani]|uniref:glycosyltransferase n=1 Tax=Herbiconiux solani TaxID=661329 RepID=UPI000824901B|nr:glycosyltransferase [Herbiconiux solani]